MTASREDHEMSDAESASLKLILKHWTDETTIKDWIDLPFNIEAFCRENDAIISHERSRAAVGLSESERAKLTEIQAYSVECYPDHKDAMFLLGLVNRLTKEQTR